GRRSRARAAAGGVSCRAREAVRHGAALPAIGRDVAQAGARNRPDGDAVPLVVIAASVVQRSRRAGWWIRQGFFTHAMQYPLGLIVPSTPLQLAGATNCRHSLHFLSPLGLSWYCIACLLAFC